MTKAEAIAATPPPAVRAELQRIMDGAARRLLADELEAQPVGTARPHADLAQHRGDRRPLLGGGQPIPVVGADPSTHREAA